jgi:hypothetical protein
MSKEFGKKNLLFLKKKKQKDFYPLKQINYHLIDKSSLVLSFKKEQFFS